MDVLFWLWVFSAIAVGALGSGFGATLLATRHRRLKARLRMTEEMNYRLRELLKQANKRLEEPLFIDTEPMFMDDTDPECPYKVEPPQSNQVPPHRNPTAPPHPMPAPAPSEKRLYATGGILDGTGLEPGKKFVIEGEYEARLRWLNTDRFKAPVIKKV